MPNRFPMSDQAAFESKRRQLAQTIERIRDASAVFVATAHERWSPEQSRVFRQKYGESSGELLRYNLGALPTALRLLEEIDSPDQETRALIDLARALETTLRAATSNEEPLNSIAHRLFARIERAPFETRHAGTQPPEDEK